MEKYRKNYHPRCRKLLNAEQKKFNAINLILYVCSAKFILLILCKRLYINNYYTSPSEKPSLLNVFHTPFLSTPTLEVLPILYLIM